MILEPSTDPVSYAHRFTPGDLAGLRLWFPERVEAIEWTLGKPRRRICRDDRRWESRYLGAVNSWRLRCSLLGRIPLLVYYWASGIHPV
jgi:hypothetical protein